MTTYLLWITGIGALFFCAWLAYDFIAYVWYGGDDPLTVMREQLRRVPCMIGLHKPGQYLGKVAFDNIDYETHAITYANIKQCPLCKKELERSYCNSV